MTKAGAGEDDLKGDYLPLAYSESYIPKMGGMSHAERTSAYNYSFDNVIFQIRVTMRRELICIVRTDRSQRDVNDSLCLFSIWTSLIDTVENGPVKVSTSHVMSCDY